MRIRSRHEVPCAFYEDILILVLTDVEFYALQCASPSRNILVDYKGVFSYLAFVLGNMEGKHMLI